MPRSFSTRRLVVLILALAVAGVSWAARPASQAATIQIRLTPEGLQVTPEQVVVRPGEEIVWSSEHQFAVDFQRGQALFGRELPAAARRGMANRPLRARAAENAPAGSYKYSVAVWDGENLWVVDPEILIRPERLQR